jgi:hypothetical protein
VKERKKPTQNRDGRKYANQSRGKFGKRGIEFEPFGIEIS